MKTLRIRPLAIWLLLAAPLLTGCVSLGEPVERWHYEVTIGEKAHRLDVIASFPDRHEKVRVAAGAEPYVQMVEVEKGSTWHPIVPEDDGGWRLPSEVKGVRRIRWRFDLAGAASHTGNAKWAADRAGGAFLSPPSTWLLRPRSGDARVRMHVKTADGVRFATGIFPAEGGPDTYEFTATRLREQLPLTAMGNLDLTEIEVGGGRVQVVRLPGRLRVSDDVLMDYVERAARAVAAYYDRYPVPHALVVIDPGARGLASASGGGGAVVHLPVSRYTRARHYQTDWTMCHEMVHLACPNVPARHHWLEEGLATYVEPLGRLAIGDITVEQVWKDLVEGLPQGLPEPGDRGLDRTHTWGRTYWGGALYCLIADIQIRKQTDGEKGLRDALQAIVAANGTIAAHWPIENILEIGDEAIGVAVLEPLYEQMREDPYDVDLPELWRRLGVKYQRGRVTFDDDAPMAEIRKAITDLR